MKPTTTNDVLSAVHDLHRRTDRWPTPAAIAAQLGCPIGQVQGALRDLRRTGVLVCRKRGNGRNQRREWMPRGAR